jgi:rare lipoprotein A (peptidoglycan hydrolase)
MGQHGVVKINDRGPQGRGKRHLLGLSEAAAKRVGLAPRGVKPVWVVVVEEAPGVSHPIRDRREYGADSS